MALLPVSAVVDELLAALQSASQVMLEPRRLAAKNVVLRLALLLDVQRGLRDDLKVLNHVRNS